MHKSHIYIIFFCIWANAGFSLRSPIGFLFFPISVFKETYIGPYTYRRTQVFLGCNYGTRVEQSNPPPMLGKQNTRIPFFGLRTSSSRNNEENTALWHRQKLPRYIGNRHYFGPHCLYYRQNRHRAILSLFHAFLPIR